MAEFDKLYTVEDIAKMTSLTSRTIRNYLKNGSLTGKKSAVNGGLLCRTLKIYLISAAFLRK